MYAGEKDHEDISGLLECWSRDPQSVQDIRGMQHRRILGRTESPDMS